jgi:hypothetical protein
VEDLQSGSSLHEQKGFSRYRFNAPLAVAAAIILVILTVAIQGNLEGRRSYGSEFQEIGIHASQRMEK